MTFQEQRRNGIGASDTAAILRLSDWANPYTVAVEKILGTFQPEAEHLKWGRLMEPLLLEEFRERTGLECVKPTPFWKHPDHEFIFANCDGIQRNENPEYVVEAKNSRFGDGFGPDGSDEVPVGYNIQVQHQMMVTGARLAYLIVLIGGNTCRLYKIDYSQEIVDEIIPVLKDFWTNYIEERLLPQPDFEHPATHRIVKQSVKLNPSLELDCEPGSPLYDLAQRYELMRRVEKLAAGEKDSLKSQIRVHSQGAGLITFPDGTKITQKKQKRRGYVVKETEYETMNLTWKGQDLLGTAIEQSGIKPLALGDLRQGEESDNHKGD